MKIFRWIVAVLCGGAAVFAVRFVFVLIFAIHRASATPLANVMLVAVITGVISGLAFAGVFYWLTPENKHLATRDTTVVMAILFAMPQFQNGDITSLVGCATFFAGGLILLKIVRAREAEQREPVPAEYLLDTPLDDSEDPR